ncbi:hypothetical protein CTAYLR_000758 [Chrysophaeum taylorii]|uniref:Nucleotide exchange factor SIL1 n=1 Tax=Chrysophaeum taylorii TaxID=2483200 RepID=A0AAD7XQS2_9STRA|nr:hypothetical protein CTAYLR_000758 [Chrysophaeum taylorii]
MMMGGRFGVMMLWMVLASGSWIEWPREAAVPVGSSVRVDLSTGQRWIESNSTEDAEVARLLGGGSATQEVGSPKGLAVATAPDVDSAFRESVDMATRGEDPSYDASGVEVASSSRREKILSALHKLPDVEQARLASKAGAAALEEATDDGLEAVWNGRQAELSDLAEAAAKPAEMLAARLEILRGFVAAGDDEARALAELEDLEYDLADVDNARDFHDSLDGVPVLRSLLETRFSPAVRAAAAAALGTAVKNDDHLQRSMIRGEDSALDRLVVAVEDGDVARKALYAIGATVRNNPDATLAFAESGGLRAVTATLDFALASLADDSNDADAWAVADKAVTLLGDLAPHLVYEPPLCRAVADTLRILPRTRRAERFLRAAAVFAAHHQCGPTWSGLREPLDALARDFWRGDDALDADFREELASLAHTIAETLPTPA